MARSTCILLLALITILPLSHAPAEETVDQILEGIRERYGTLPGLTVEYEREIVTRTMSMLGVQTKGDAAAGLIHFRPPNHLKVAQQTPTTEYVISDGDTLWWYIPHKALAYRYPSRKLGKGLQVLSDVFQGLQKAGDSFRIDLSADEAGREYLLKLFPDPPWQEVEHIALRVDPEDYRIQMVEIYDYVGGITRFILGKLTVRRDLEEETFRFSPPQGVRVLDDSAP